MKWTIRPQREEVPPPREVVLTLTEKEFRDLYTSYNVHRMSVTMTANPVTALDDHMFMVMRDLNGSAGERR